LPGALHKSEAVSDLLFRSFQHLGQPVPHYRFHCLGTPLDGLRLSRRGQTHDRSSLLHGARLHALHVPLPGVLLSEQVPWADSSGHQKY
ncbi:transient receptor potential cation channel subfamily M member 2, partial [Biomphalaria glabrata]